MAHWKDEDPKRCFDGRAELYERSRPGYPPKAVAAVLAGLGEPGRLRVADVGAGTGLLTRSLAEHGCRVVAIEPNADMRSAAPRLEGVEWRDGTGEATGLAEGSVDLVTVAQAFHWMEPARALPELRRVLVPRGRLALLWNDRRLESALEIAYHELVEELKPPERRGRPPRLASAALSRSSHFEEPRLLEFELEHSLDAETLIARTLSLSYAPREASRREALSERLRALHAAQADASGRASLRYLTRVHLTEARG